MFKDLADFINFLEEKNELVRISTPVSSELEITEIADRTKKNNVPALLFENVDEKQIPVLINLFGSESRMAWALGIDNLNELSDIANKLINLPKNPPKSLMGKLKILNELINLSKSSPKILKKAPCQDIVLTGSDINLF